MEPNTLKTRYGLFPLIQRNTRNLLNKDAHFDMGKYSYKFNAQMEGEQISISFYIQILRMFEIAICPKNLPYILGDGTRWKENCLFLSTMCTKKPLARYCSNTTIKNVFDSNENFLDKIEFITELVTKMMKFFPKK